MATVSFGIVALLGSKQVLVADAAGHAARSCALRHVACELAGTFGFGLPCRAPSAYPFPVMLRPVLCWACGLVAQLVRAHA